MLDLAGRVVLVAGARRVGAVVARRIAAAGADVAVTYRTSRGEAAALSAELAEAGVRTALIQADLATDEGARAAVADAEAALGGLSSAVNLASGFPRTPYAGLDESAWDRSMADAKASYLLALHASRAMMANDGPTRGHIVLFSDWAALHAPYRGYLPYMTSKAAISFMTRAFAAELAPSGILVNAIAPGPTIRPPDLDPAEWESGSVARSPLARESSADEIAEMVVTLLRSETITGEIIRIDSGRHLAGPGL